MIWRHLICQATGYLSWNRNDREEETVGQRYGFHNADLVTIILQIAQAKSFVSPGAVVSVCQNTEENLRCSRSCPQPTASIGDPAWNRGIKILPTRLRCPIPSRSTERCSLKNRSIRDGMSLYVHAARTWFSLCQEKAETCPELVFCSVTETQLLGKVIPRGPLPAAILASYRNKETAGRADVSFKPCIFIYSSEIEQ